MTHVLGDIEIGSFMAYAYVLAADSPDTSTQNAALVVRPGVGVIGQACNTFPPGVTPRHERPEKYAYIEHAERGAVYCCTRNNRPTVGAWMICPWAACADCARAVVLAGIDVLVRHAINPDLNGEAQERWRASIADGDTILREGGVRVIDWDGAMPRFKPEFTLLRDGKEFRP